MQAEARSDIKQHITKQPCVGNEEEAGERELRSKATLTLSDACPGKTPYTYNKDLFNYTSLNRFLIPGNQKDPAWNTQNNCLFLLIKIKAPL